MKPTRQQGAWKEPGQLCFAKGQRSRKVGGLQSALVRDQRPLGGDVLLGVAGRAEGVVPGMRGH